MGEHRDTTNQIKYVQNPGGPTLGYSTLSGVQILEQNGLFFKDLSKDGKLDKYEDWRLPAEERAKDLASKMTIEQIAGLMLYSSHQNVPGASGGWFSGTYGGKTYEESGAKPWEMTDEQMGFLAKDHLRHILVAAVESPEVAARWNNQIQAFVEGTGLGIPANNSSDPRHGTQTSSEFNAGSGGTISMWPETLGLAAAFEPEVVKQFGEIASKEYRALGLTTALSPQIDIATDPRWFRFNGTFGEDSKLSTDLARAYVDGFQNSEGESELVDGWGHDSVNAMVKHWPGGGSGESGRDAHFGSGKYAVYPGNNFEEHLLPFVGGAFKLDGKTRQASAVMPYYTISAEQDTVYHENVGNSYSRYLIKDLLRDKYGYDGVVCTDWMITADETSRDEFLSGKSWGVEGLTVAERHYKVLMAGVDQFGGNNDKGPVLEAYRMGVAERGEAYMRERFEQSAVRLLLNIFRLGLFENPYLDPALSSETVGRPEFMQAGYDAQLKSIVMLKNKENVLPIASKSKVYIPKRYIAASYDWFGNPVAEKLVDPVNLDIVSRYFTVTENPEEADFGLVFIEGSTSGMTGYSREDVERGGNGYVPLSLQYRPYTAEYARETSLAGDAREGDVLNRSYKGKTVTSKNEADLDTVLETKKRMDGKPVIVSLRLSNPAVVAEFEREVDAILVNFGLQDQAIMDVISGAFEPSGLLPMQMPAHMKTVEEQLEDVAHDMECHVDSEQHMYDFAYGLNWSGVIRDERTMKYAKR
ncbi:glycoside hydrolase family 3 protein [Paenibacillus motobuensis]|uniref:glycoside hydrolase family 3 protein n=1 Tax=Paenibacillus TaxID=44249 RepID=UPI00204168FA|nr:MULTISPECIES: glycoside hydrolase family 3 N-terminal domain-containing protein [Paenibacillus]MCM3041402.1 glycoside hydrolase family 3 protein [Paenibacillus lutimineralis]MCM3648506.1 glycoside hydrolase family 3 protein [Paenibacillus motobuensis]